MKGMPPGGWLALAALMTLLGLFTSWPPYRFYGDDMALLAVSFKHITPRLHECGPEELARFLAAREGRPRHMQDARAECGSRERQPLALRISIDGAVRREIAIVPSGWRHDAAVFALERVPVAAGRHAVALEIGDTGAPGEFNYRFERELDFAPREVVTASFEAPLFRVIRR